MAFEDELPEVPQTQDQPSIDDQIDYSLFQGVGKLGDVIPKGTYHFRLDGFTEAVYDGEPYFNLQWKCQEEPHTGRMAFDMISWVKPEDIKAANDASNPRVNEARGVLNKRLVRANSLMDAAGFKPNGKFGFKDFLNTHPEVKLILNVNERKTKKLDANGQPVFENGKKVYVGTGEMQNQVSKYVSLVRPS